MIGDTTFTPTIPVGFDIRRANGEIIGLPDGVTIVYNYLFTSKDRYRVKNTRLLAILDVWLSEGVVGLDLIKAFAKEKALLELHPSLMQTTLIMLAKVEGLDLEKERIKTRISQVLPKYQ